MNNKYTSLGIIIGFAVISLFFYLIGNNAYGESLTPTPTPTASSVPTPNPSSTPEPTPEPTSTAPPTPTTPTTPPTPPTPPTNNPPKLGYSGKRTVYQGEILTLTVSGTDPDGDRLAFTDKMIPSGATFTVSSQGVPGEIVGTLLWDTKDARPTLYRVGFKVSDGRTVASTSTVLEVQTNPNQPPPPTTPTTPTAPPPTTPAPAPTGTPNRPPVFNYIGHKNIKVNHLLEFSISATDPDGDVLTYSATKLPPGASLKGQTFRFKPTKVDLYLAVFKVSDGELSDIAEVLIFAYANTPPKLNPIGDKTVEADRLLQFGVSAFDRDGDTLRYSTTARPRGAEFKNQTFSWRPTEAQVRDKPYSITFIVSDGEDTDRETIGITVTARESSRPTPEPTPEPTSTATPPPTPPTTPPTPPTPPTNQPPKLGYSGKRSVYQGEILTLTVSGTDPDGDRLEFIDKMIPSGATFTVSSQGVPGEIVGTLLWDTKDARPTLYRVGFKVSDGHTVVATSTVLEVQQNPNQPTTPTTPTEPPTPTTPTEPPTPTTPAPAPTGTPTPTPSPTCTSLGYTDCTTGSEAEIKDRLCCASNEKCCNEDKRAGAVCCSKEMCWDKEDEEENKEIIKCQVCKYDETEITKIPIAYCYIQGCNPINKPRSLQLCKGSFQNICCKKEPEEYCGFQHRGWGVFKKAYCSKYPTECPSDTEPCLQPEEYRTDKPGPPLCCKKRMEECLPDKHFKGIVRCNPYKCEYGEPCKGQGDYGDYKKDGKDYKGYYKCCDAGQTCFHHPNGYPRCVTTTPSESTPAGESVYTSSFSIYLYRTPPCDEFQRDGLAYRFRPHGLKFSKDININIKDFKPTERLYKYPDESYINSCSVEVLKEWSIVVGPAGANIRNEYFELEIPAGALAEDTVITIDRINIACPREGCCNQEPLTTPVLEGIEEYYRDNLTKEELQSIIDKWTASGLKRINFNDYPVSSYAGAEDINPKILSIEDDGTTLHLAGNTWKKIDFPYRVSSQTVIEFDFKSGRGGGIHAIGFDTDLVASPKHAFKLYGTRRWGRLRYNNYRSAGGWKHYQIPIGRYYTGSFKYLFFVNDDDAHSAADSYFRNVQVYEE